jgi:hypothetical protein
MKVVEQALGLMQKNSWMFLQFRVPQSQWGLPERLALLVEAPAALGG